MAAPRAPVIEAPTAPGLARTPQLRPTGSGQAVAAAGTALRRGGAQLAGLARERAEEDAALYGSRVMSNARSDWDARTRAAKVAAPDGAPEFTPTLLQDFDAYAKREIEGAPELVRPWLQQRLDGLRDTIASDALEFEAGARLNNRVRNVQQVIAANANTVRTAPEQLAGLVGETRGMIDSLKLPAKQKAGLRAETDERIVRSYFEGLNQTDPWRAKAELEDGRFKAMLPPETLDVLATENAVEIRRIEAERSRAADQAEASYRARVDEQVVDAVALIRETGTQDVVSDPELDRAYGESADAMRAELAHERAYYITRTDLALTSPEQDAAYVQDLQAGIAGEGAAFEIELRDLAVETVAAKRDALRKDPAAYVLTASPEAAAGYEAAQESGDPELWSAYLTQQREMQRGLGVPDHAVALLGQGQASFDAAQIGAAAPEDMADAIEARRRMYGEQHWPTVWKELNAAGLPRSARILGVMDRPEDAKARVDFAAALSAGQKDMKEILGTTATRDVGDQVAGQLAEFYTSAALQGDGVRLAGDVQAATETLALYHASRGMSPEDAAKTAADAIVHSRYQFGPTYRVSAGNLPQMELKARRALDGLQPEDLPALPGGDPNLSDAYRRDQARLAAERGFWVTNEDETGIYRVDQAGNVVELENGERLEILESDPIPATRATQTERQQARRGAVRGQRQTLPEPPRAPRARGQSARRQDGQP